MHSSIRIAFPWLKATLFDYLFRSEIVAITIGCSSRGEAEEAEPLVNAKK